MYYVCCSGFSIVLVSAIMAYNGHVISGDVYAWTVVLVLPINSALNPYMYTLSAVVGRKVQTNFQI